MILAIVQARMESTRLPGKAMLDLGGKPMLWHVLMRVRQATTLDQIILLTPWTEANEVLIPLAEHCGIEVIRSTPNNLLASYLEAARSFDASAIVRITADCPLINPAVIDQVVMAFLAPPPCDYAANVLHYTWPEGLDTEVLTMEALTRCEQLATALADRQHVTTYIRTHPEQFTLRSVESPLRLGHLHWSVDTAQDFEMMRLLWPTNG